MRTLARLLLATALGVTVLAPTAAHAEKKVFSDPRGDVQVLAYAEDDGGDEVPPARPSRTSVADVRRVALDHTGDRIAVKVRLREVTRRGVSGYIVVLVGSNGRRLEAIIDNEGGTADALYLERPGRGTLSQRCKDSARHRVAYDDDTVSLGLARHCLGRPQRVRVAVLSAWLQDRGEGSITAYDIGFRDGGRADRRWGFSGAVRHTR